MDNKKPNQRGEGPGPEDRPFYWVFVQVFLWGTALSIWHRLSDTFTELSGGSQIAFPVVVITVAGASIVSYVYVNALYRSLAKHQENPRTRLAVAELFAAKRNRSARLSFALVIALAVYGLDSGHNMAYYLGGASLILLWSDQLVLAYRIRRGYYAMNQHEAKEFLLFLIAHADREDFSDGDGTRELFPTPEEIAVGSDSYVRQPGYAEA